MTVQQGHNCPQKGDLLVQTQLNIDKFGLQIIMVDSTSYLPSFAYSIGLTQTYGHPEVICLGLPNNLGHAIINDVAAIIRGGATIKTGAIYTEIFEGSSATFLKVDARNIGDYFGAALNYYGDKRFDALQLVWTDRNDKFPWEENFEAEFIYMQPLLDRNAEFKFREPKHLGVFTTRQWLELGAPILRVVHDSEGDWQFLTGDQLPEDIRLVALAQIILKDVTLRNGEKISYQF